MACNDAVVGVESHGMAIGVWCRGRTVWKGCRAIVEGVEGG
jgi:hypothetical protein